MASQAPAIASITLASRVAPGRPPASGQAAPAAPHLIGRCPDGMPLDKLSEPLRAEPELSPNHLFTQNLPTKTERSGHMRKELIAATALTLALAGGCSGIASAQQSTTIQLAQRQNLSRGPGVPHQSHPGGGSRGADQPARSREITERAGPSGFAERMVQDHTTANQKLLGLAQGVSNTSQTKIDQKHQAMLQQLSQLSGEDFDRQYMQEQVQDHQAAVELLQARPPSRAGLSTSWPANCCLPCESICRWLRK